MHEKNNISRNATLSDRTEGSLEDRHQDALMRFILFWGEMASNWGINRTMAQIFALLYASEVPLDTDMVMQRLQISRGNANMNLHSLVNWNLVRKVHQTGSRKDYYIAEKDVWEITSQIIKERERREIQPVMQQLQACRDLLTESEAEQPCSDLSEVDQQFCERIENLMELMQVFEGFSKAILPFLQQRNTAMIKQFIQLAESMQR